MDITAIVAHRSDDRLAQFSPPRQLGGEEWLYIYHDMEMPDGYANERPDGLTGYPETNVIFGPGGDTIPLDEKFQNFMMKINPQMPASGLQGLMNKWNKNKWTDDQANFVINPKRSGITPKYPSKLVFGGNSLQGVLMEWMGGYGVAVGEKVYKIKTLDARKLPTDLTAMDYRYAIHHLTNATTSVYKDRQVINPFPNGRDEGHSYYMAVVSNGLDVYIKAAMVKPVKEPPNPFWPEFLKGAT
jgi:hypothetical protein